MLIYTLVPTFYDVTAFVDYQPSWSIFDYEIYLCMYIYIHTYVHVFNIYVYSYVYTNIYDYLLLNACYQVLIHIRKYKSHFLYTWVYI
jgi:hypothetical protein